MFKNLRQTLDNLSTTLSIPVEADEEGYYDKECPSEGCLFPFKVNGEDWGEIVRDEEVFCPYCRHSAPADQWWTRDQIDNAQKYATDYVRGRLARAMHEDARKFNRGQRRNSLISMNLDVKAAVPVLLPISAAEPMRLRTICDSCGCRYSYLGAAFFCPACGENSAIHTFSQTLGTIRASANAAESIRSVLSKDDAEVTLRALREKALQDVVTSFQRLAENLYHQLPNPRALRRNVFQSLDAGSEEWRSAAGKGYENFVSNADLKRLKIFFQQRHLLAHQQGIVDDDYILRSGDNAYLRGQRIMVTDSAVLEAITLIERLAEGLIASAS